uniref:Uncharacterized protein n=1 Tax=Acrobeloides nanus TaxID=290746 RepID=A0A914D8R0_9BILA
MDWELVQVWALAFFEQLRSFLVVLPFLLYYWVEGMVKAFLPLGILPRKSVNGDLVLITGAGSGLGRLLAIEFGKLGSRLVLWDINEKWNSETKEILRKQGVEAHAYTVDLSDRKQIYEQAEKVKNDVGDIDILINNAGIVSGKKLFDCPDVLMEKTMAVNTIALFFTAKAFLPSMLARNRGHVVTIASMAGKAGVAGLVDYCASKFGAVGFSESLRAEVLSLQKDVEVTTVCPYYINTGMFDGVATYSPNVLPILEPEYVVDRIVEAVLTNQPELYLPRFSYLVAAIRGMIPTKAADVLANYYGVNKTMDHFVGRPKTG